MIEAVMYIIDKVVKVKEEQQQQQQQSSILVKSVQQNDKVLDVDQDSNVLDSFNMTEMNGINDLQSLDLEFESSNDMEYLSNLTNKSFRGIEV